MKKMILFMSMILFCTLVFTPSTYSIYTYEGDQICFVDNVNFETNFDNPLALTVDYCYIGDSEQSAIVNCFTTNIIENPANIKLSYEKTHKKCLALNSVNPREEIEVVAIGDNNKTYYFIS